VETRHARSHRWQTFVWRTARHKLLLITNRLGCSQGNYVDRPSRDVGHLSELAGCFSYSVAGNLIRIITEARVPCKFDSGDSLILGTVDPAYCIRVQQRIR
jgi:hypothetical protein